MVSTTEGGVLLAIEIVPSADRDAFPSGYNPWRERIEARVQAPAQQGKANQALCALVAEVLGLEKRSVEVKHGASSRRKTLLLHGADVDAVRTALEDVLE